MEMSFNTSMRNAMIGKSAHVGEQAMNYQVGALSSDGCTEFMGLWSLREQNWVSSQIQEPE